MSQPTSLQYRFGEFCLDVAERRLLRAGVTIPLAPKVFDTLLLLVENPGHLIEKEEFMRKLWPDTFVGDDALARNISLLRRALGGTSDSQSVIATVPKRGYRFVAEVDHNGSKRGNFQTADLWHIAKALHTEAAPSVQQTIAPTPVQPSGSNRHETSTFMIPSPTPAASPSWLRPVPFVLFTLVLGVLAGVITFYLLHPTPSLSRYVFGMNTTPSIHSVAVLPLQNLSGDPAQEYFSDGMTDALITDLAQIRSLRVISRTSTIRYKNSSKPLGQIARELNVDGIIEGTVQRSGDRVKITAQLIEANSDRHVWANSYDRELRDTLRLQEEVAHDISQRISANVGTVPGPRPASAYPLNIGAYDEYLKARNYISRQTKADVIKGKEILERSIERDPNYAPAYAELAFAHYVLATVDHSSLEEIVQAKAAALHALTLDENLAEAHSVLGLIDAMHDWDWPAGGRELQRAIQSDPNSSFAQSQFALYLVTVGRKTEAIREINTALELDPFSPMQHSSASFVFLYAREYDSAMREALRAVEIDPHFALGHLGLSSVLHAEGKPEEAFTEWLRFLRESGETVFAQELENAAKKKPGPGEPLQKVANIVLRHYQENSNHQSTWAVNIAWAYMFLGDKDKAFMWLNKACDEHAMEVYAIAVDPDIDPLRSDPRFAAILRRIGLPSSN